MKKILITGHMGLIGRHLSKSLGDAGFAIKPFDVRDGSGDVLDHDATLKAVLDCDGVVHLAAVSRVVWAESDPDLCWATNAESIDPIIAGALASPKHPWIIAASSREVYGQATKLPVREDAELLPVNIYGRSKEAMERAISRSQGDGLVASTIRLSNVYGCPLDHVDRAIPAFCRAAIRGEALRVDGEDTLFDFTHVSDVVRGIILLIARLEATKASVPTLQFVTGVGTSLLDAASLAVTSAGSKSRIDLGPARTYDVARFVGDGRLASELLGWKARIEVSRGISDLIARLTSLDQHGALTADIGNNGGINLNGKEGVNGHD